MRLLFSFLLIIGGICGIAMGFLSNIEVHSSLAFIDGLELSVWLGLFSVFVFLSGVYNMLGA